jgi:hypothetical protein
LFGRKESKKENSIFLWLRERVRQCAKKTFKVARRLIGRRKWFWEVFIGFPEFFWKISIIFLEFSAIFLENFPKNFAIFFDFCDSPTIFPENFSENFSENSRSQSVTVQPGSRHYCKFTSKFTSRITPKFTLILIKILQSTKFEGSHFFNSLSTFTTFFNSLSTFTTFHNSLTTFTAIHNLLRPPKTLPLAAAFSQS